MKLGFNFQMVFFSLKSFEYEASDNLRSIHEIPPLGFEGERLDENLNLENYEGHNPRFVSEYEMLRKHTSLLVPRSKLVFI